MNINAAMRQGGAGAQVQRSGEINEFAERLSKEIVALRAAAEDLTSRLMPLCAPPQQLCGAGVNEIEGAPMSSYGAHLREQMAQVASVRELLSDALLRLQF